MENGDDFDKETKTTVDRKWCSKGNRTVKMSQFKYNEVCVCVYVCAIEFVRMSFVSELVLVIVQSGISEL